MYNLKRELSNRSKKKLSILLVDMDQVQKTIVEAISELPMPVFIVGSANRNVDSSVVASKGNFHFVLAQRSKDSADAVITIAATKLQDLIVAYDRQKDVVFATISDDRIFETVTHTLRQGGALATDVSCQGAARGLRAVSRMLSDPALRRAIRCEQPWCMVCRKTFGSVKSLEQHQDVTGHSEMWQCVLRWGDRGMVQPSDMTRVEKKRKTFQALFFFLFVRGRHFCR